MSDGWTN
jgi:hypothetical protein